MKSGWAALFVGLLLVLTGCGLGEADGEGYIIEVNGSQIIVVSDVDEAQLSLGWNALFASGDFNGTAIRLSTGSSKYKTGQYVKYWVDGGVNMSYPAQAKARKVTIVTLP